MTDNPRQTLACGCTVETYRDFLGRMVGRIVTRGDQCPRAEHLPEAVIVMPGRENARPD